MTHDPEDRWVNGNLILQALFVFADFPQSYLLVFVVLDIHDDAP